MTFNEGRCTWFAGFQSTPMRPASGTASLSSSRYLARNSRPECVHPVMLPPGCARLATMPLPTGSAVNPICGKSDDDGDRGRGPLGSQGCWGGRCDDDIHFEA